MQKYLIILLILFTAIFKGNDAKKDYFNIGKKLLSGMNNNETIVYNQLKKDGYTNEAAAAVMGVVGGESNFLTLKEASYRNTKDNNYIRAIFYRLRNYTDAELNLLKQDDPKFFETVYGGLYGNTQPGDGWKYVGRGFNGITFKANYQNLKNQTGIDFVNNPQLLENPNYAAIALSNYFKPIKNIADLDTAFKEAYRRNAGPTYPFSYYENSTNPVHVKGIPLKRNKAKEYYNSFGLNRAALFFFVIDSCNGNMVFSQKIKDHKKITDIENFINSLKN